MQNTDAMVTSIVPWFQTSETANAVSIGDQMINFHRQPGGRMRRLHFERRQQPPCGDLCLVWTGPRHH
jgi:hypothetical protein